jgi:hypothetical protein
LSRLSPELQRATWRLIQSLDGQEVSLETVQLTVEQIRNAISEGWESRERETGPARTQDQEIEQPKAASSVTSPPAQVTAAQLPEAEQTPTANANGTKPHSRFHGYSSLKALVKLSQNFPNAQILAQALIDDQLKAQRYYQAAGRLESCCHALRAALKAQFPLLHA